VTVLTRCEQGHIDCYGHVTIRARRKDEPDVPFWATGVAQKVPRWVVVDADDSDRYLGGFGMVDGGKSKGEAVFWAERFALKNGYTFIRPAGFEKVRAKEPSDD
jgi:hypothetical protein